MKKVISIVTIFFCLITLFVCQLNDIEEDYEKQSRTIYCTAYVLLRGSLVYFQKPDTSVLISLYGSKGLIDSKKPDPEGVVIFENLIDDIYTVSCNFCPTCITNNASVQMGFSDPVGDSPMGIWDSFTVISRNIYIPKYYYKYCKGQDHYWINFYSISNW